MVGRQAAAYIDWVSSFVLPTIYVVWVACSLSRRDHATFGAQDGVDLSEIGLFYQDEA